VPKSKSKKDLSKLFERLIVDIHQVNIEEGARSSCLTFHSNKYVVQTRKLSPNKRNDEGHDYEAI
jgi:hypothetical protein